jgi:hypothetical protein
VKYVRANAVGHLMQNGRRVRFWDFIVWTMHNYRDVWKLHETDDSPAERAAKIARARRAVDRMA